MNNDHLTIEVYQCHKCKLVLPVADFNKATNRATGIQANCRNCEKLYKNKLEVKEREKQRRLSPKYRAEDRARHQTPKCKKAEKIRRQSPKYKAYKRIYNSKPKTRLILNIRRAISRVIRGCGFLKNKYTEDIVGITAVDLCDHIESMFWPGMTWENMGNKGKWQLDHTVPLSNANEDLSKIEELNHYTNLQPLWTDDNLTKKNRLDWTVAESKHPLPEHLTNLLAIAIMAQMEVENV